MTLDLRRYDTASTGARASLERDDHLVSCLEAAAFLLPPSPAARVWKQLPGGAVLRKLWNRRSDNRAAALSLQNGELSIHLIACR